MCKLCAVLFTPTFISNLKYVETRTTPLVEFMEVAFISCLLPLFPVTDSLSHLHPRAACRGGRPDQGNINARCDALQLSQMCSSPHPPSHTHTHSLHPLIASFLFSQYCSTVQYSKQSPTTLLILFLSCTISYECCYCDFLFCWSPLLTTLLNRAR